MTTSPVRVRHSIPIWTLSREAGFHWLALGLLLAAWNASYNEVAEADAQPRPTALGTYPHVSVRAMEKLREATKGHNSVNVL